MGKKKTNKKKSKGALSKQQRKEVKDIANKETNKKVDILHYDHKFIGSQGGTYFILPYGVDSDLLKGNICGDALPVNQLDNIHLTGLNPNVPGDSYRSGDQIFLKHIAVKLRILAPVFNPATTLTTTAINKQGPQTASKVRLLVILDKEGDQSLNPASTNTGVIGEMYDDIAQCTSLKRFLPTFKQYVKDSRFEILKTKILNLDARKPFVDYDFSITLNRKINYVPDTDDCQTAIYLFAMSDYPANVGSHTQDPPRIESFWLRYYYTDS